MRKFFLALLLNFIFSQVAFGGDDKWYIGGTLHNSYAYEWNTATPENKIATAGDWISGTTREDILMMLMKDNAQALKLAAFSLCVCVDTVAKDNSNIKSSTIALMCMSQLKKDKPTYFSWFLTKSH